MTSHLCRTAWLPALAVLVILAVCSGCDPTGDRGPGSESGYDRVAPADFDLQGHRGARGLLPENTIPSFLRALDLQVRTIELDLAVTADSVVVVSHEPWFSSIICSTPDGRPVSAENERTYNIYRMTYDEVRAFDCGSRGNRLFPTQEAMAAYKPRLDSTFQVLDRHASETGRDEPRYNVEIKSRPEFDVTFTPDPSAFAGLVYDVIRDEGVTERTTVQSFDSRPLRALREIDPALSLALLVDNELGLARNLEELSFTPSIYSPHHRLVDRVLVDSVHALGMQIIPWTVNDTRSMERLVTLGVDGLITDYPDSAHQIVYVVPTSGPVSGLRNGSSTAGAPDDGEAVSERVTSARADVWYKGNTHAHTELSGHADSSPEYVARWYLGRGYHFLILSEHNQFINPESVELPADRRDDFILIPGEEVTGNQVIHTTAMNIERLVDWTADHEHKHQIIQSHVDSTIDAGGTPILNHPNFHWAVTADDVLPVRRLHMFELYNGHPHVHNHGDAEHPSTEEMWDQMLTGGMLIYGVSSDDAHEFQEWSENVSNPGRGWVMVRADALTADGITQGMRSGDFYATSGVILADLTRDEGTYRVEVDEEATHRELSSPYLIGHRLHSGGTGEEGRDGFRIEFVGENGTILESVPGTRAAFRMPPDQPYIRSKVTYRRPAEGGGEVAYYAWTQPVFTDERAELASSLANNQPEIHPP